MFLARCETKGDAQSPPPPPHQVSDTDPRLSVSGMQRFQGEDLNYEGRKQDQQEQRRCVRSVDCTSDSGWVGHSLALCVSVEVLHQ